MAHHRQKNLFCSTSNFPYKRRRKEEMFIFDKHERDRGFCAFAPSSPSSSSSRSEIGFGKPPAFPLSQSVSPSFEFLNSNVFFFTPVFFVKAREQSAQEIDGVFFFFFVKQPRVMPKSSASQERIHTRKERREGNTNANTAAAKQSALFCVLNSSSPTP